MERFRIALQENNFISSSGTNRPTNQRCDSRIFFGVVDLTKLKGLSLKVCTAVCSRETIIEFRQNHQITQRARTNIRWGMFSVKQNKNYFSKTFMNILSTINQEEVGFLYCALPDDFLSCVSFIWWPNRLGGTERNISFHFVAFLGPVVHNVWWVFQTQC